MREIGDPLPIGAPGWVSLRDPTRPRQVARRAALSRRRPDVAPGFDEHSLSGGRETAGAHEFARVDEAGLAGGLLTWNLNGHRMRRLGAQIQEPEIRTVDEGDLSLASSTRSQCGPAHVVVTVMRDLAVVVIPQVVSPEIETLLGAAIRQIVEMVAMPHGGSVDALPQSN